MVTIQTPDPSPPPAARVVFMVGLAAAGRQAHHKHLLRITEGDEEF